MELQVILFLTSFRWNLRGNWDQQISWVSEKNLMIRGADKGNSRLQIDWWLTILGWKRLQMSNGWKRKISTYIIKRFKQSNNYNRNVEFSGNVRRDFITIFCLSITCHVNREERMWELTWAWDFFTILYYFIYLLVCSLYLELALLLLKKLHGLIICILLLVIKKMYYTTYTMPVC